MSPPAESPGVSLQRTTAVPWFLLSIVAPPHFRMTFVGLAIGGSVDNGLLFGLVGFAGTS